MDYIKIEHVNKQIGKEHVLRDVNISFEAGKIHGLIGRNGCGKTVLLRIICGLYRAASGTVCVNGQYVGQDVEFPASTGILIESPGFIPYYSGYKNLQVLAELNYRTTDAMVRNAISLVGLSADEKKSVGKYSLGMRQRLGIAQVFMENPQLLILDEPMNGLDNKGVSDMRMLFKKLRYEGKTILHRSFFTISICCPCVTKALSQTNNLMMCKKGTTRKH